MKFKSTKVQYRKMLVVSVTLFVLIGAALIPFINVMTRNTFLEEKSISVSPQNSDSQETVVGDPEDPLDPPQVKRINPLEYFNTIQDAIYDSDTHDSDIIQVNSSIYPENVIVNKSLTIRGIDTGTGLPIINGGSGIGFHVTVNNVTIENMNISDSSIGIFCNHSGLSVQDNTFWFNNYSIDFNHTSNFIADTNYCLYDNLIIGNLFMINTTNNVDAAIKINVALNYQNHSGAAKIGNFTITDNLFMLNNSHAYAVLFNDVTNLEDNPDMLVNYNYIKNLENGSISLGIFNFSNNILYKNNSLKTCVLFSGFLTQFTNDNITVGDIIVSNNIVIDHFEYPAFQIEQYTAKYWNGTTTGVFGDLRVINNTISSQFGTPDGIQVREINWQNFSDSASLTVGECIITQNHVNISDGYGIIFFMNCIGYGLQNNASIHVDTVRITDNILSASVGLSLNDVSYIGYDMADNATFIMGDIFLDNNQIQSDSDGIYFSEILIGENLLGSSTCSIGNFTLNNNCIVSGGAGIIFIENESSFRLGNSMSDNSVVSLKDIEFCNNTINNSVSGLLIGPSMFTGENENLTVESFTVANNTISFCSTGLIIKNFSISDWCQPVIKNNTIDNCSMGIWFDSSYGSLIYNNYLDNTLNAKDDTDNTWNVTKTAGRNIIGGAYLGGNFWSDYTGVDGDDDTLGDTLLPYNAMGNISLGGDLHPLTLVKGDLTLTPPTDFTATVVGLDQINLSWIKGIHAVYTRVMQKTGWSRVAWRDLTGGIVAMHRAWRDDIS